MTEVSPMSKVRAVSSGAHEVFCGLSNGLIIYAIAGACAVAQNFGQIAVLLTLLAAAIGVLRGALGTPLLLMAGRARSDIRREGSLAFTSALLVSPIVASVMWAVQGSGIRLPAILIILATPFVLVKDVLRQVAIAEGRLHVATRWDGVFFAGSAALLVAAWLHLPVATTSYLIGGWTALTVLALVGMLIAVRIAPRLRQCPAWIAKGWRDRARYGIDSGLQQTTAFAVLLFTAVVLESRGHRRTARRHGIAGTRGHRGECDSIGGDRREQTPKHATGADVESLARIALVSTSVTILLGVVLALLPGTVGELVLGPTFEATRAIIPVVAFGYAIGAWINALPIWLQTSNRSADALMLKASYALVMVVTALGGAALFRTAVGVAVGLVTATTFVTALALLRFKPWATPTGPSRPDRRQRVAPYTSPAAGAVAAANDLVQVGVPRPLPVATRLRLGETTQVNGPLIALLVFATMAVFVPVAIIRVTGIPTNASWLWSLPAIAISAARFAFLVGKGEQRLFEMMFWCV